MVRSACSEFNPVCEENLRHPIPESMSECWVQVEKLSLVTTASLGDIVMCDANGEYSINVGTTLVLRWYYVAVSGY